MRKKLPHSTPRGYCLSPLIGLTICLAMVEWSHKLTYLTQSYVSKIDKLNINDGIWNYGPSIQSIKVGNIIELIAKCALLIFNIWATRCPVTQLKEGSLGHGAVCYTILRNCKWNTVYVFTYAASAFFRSTMEMRALIKLRLDTTAMKSLIWSIQS